jgi:hypothetical protein
VLPKLPRGCGLVGLSRRMIGGGAATGDRKVAASSRGRRRDGVYNWMGCCHRGLHSCGVVMEFWLQLSLSKYCVSRIHRNGRANFSIQKSDQRLDSRLSVQSAPDVL